MERRAPLLAIAAALFAVNAAAQPVAPPVTVPAAWQIDTSHSSAQFAVRHMMVSNVRGEFGKMSGTVQWNGKAFDSAVVNVTIDATSINTREPKRDDHLRSADFFDVAKYPTITFRSTRIEPAGEGKLRMMGDLTMRGVTKPVVFDVEGPSPGVPVRDARGVARVGATATAKVNRKDFGLTWNRAIETGGVVVSDEVLLTVDVELIQRGQ